METTLNEIRKHNLHQGEFTTLLWNLGKTKPDDEPLSIIQILDSNGLGYALWCLRAVSGHDREIRLFSVWCSRQVQHLMKDERSVKALDVAERYANGEASAEELREAGDAAYDAAYAAYVAYDAVADAARTAYDAAYAAAAVADAARTADEVADAVADAAYADVADAAYAARTAYAAARTAQEKELRRVCKLKTKA